MKTSTAIRQENLFSIQQKEISEDMQIIQLSTLMELFNRPEKTMFRIFLLLAVLCILISSFGVFFLVSLSTEQRKKK